MKKEISQEKRINKKVFLDGREMHPYLIRDLEDRIHHLGEEFSTLSKQQKENLETFKYLQKIRNDEIDSNFKQCRHWIRLANKYNTVLFVLLAILATAIVLHEMQII